MSASEASVGAESPIRRAVRKILRSAGVFYNRVEAGAYDFRHKTDTTGKVAAAQLDIPGEMVERVTGFQSTNERHLRKVLDTIAFPPNSTFVDIGCGKGKALLIAAQYPFVSRVVGVELAKSLCVAADHNLEVARARQGLTMPAEIIHSDALLVEFTQGENIFFLNNPFDAEFMGRMVDRLKASKARDGRKVWLLYANPMYIASMLADPQVKPIQEFKFFGPGRNIFVFEL